MAAVADQSPVADQIVELQSSVADLQQIIDKMILQIDAYKNTTKREMTDQLVDLSNQATRLDKENVQLRAEITQMNTDLRTVANESDTIRRNRESLESTNQKMRQVLVLDR
jgi:chromosome segregation ATPase